MKVLNVPDMHCEKCVERINKALTAENIKFSVSLQDKTVTVEGCEDCAQKAIESLDNLGFSASEKV